MRITKSSSPPQILNKMFSVLPQKFIGGDEKRRVYSCRTNPASSKLETWNKFQKKKPEQVKIRFLFLTKRKQEKNYKRSVNQRSYSSLPSQGNPSIGAERSGNSSGNETGVGETCEEREGELEGSGAGRKNRSALDLSRKWADERGRAAREK